jgi:N-ethylmaleimide reductase
MAEQRNELFEPFELGPVRLANRMVMAPMSRNRADAAGAADALTARYYEQRATAGFIVTEASPVSEGGKARGNAPGIYTEGQIAGWRLVTDAVHARGGKIFLQLWHAGPFAQLPLAPDDLQINQIADVVGRFGEASRNGRDAGFDGIEVHAANGYLIDQFLRDGTNHRTDAYGGSPQNRARLLLQVLDAVAPAWPSKRVGVRLSPVNPFNSMTDSDPQRTFNAVARVLAKRELAYLHVDETSGKQFEWSAFRSCYASVYIANSGYDYVRAIRAIAARHADLVSFGVLYLANPDLLERFRKGAVLNRADRATFYTGGERGYTDYPALASVP